MGSRSYEANRGAKRAREARGALGLDPVAPVPCLLTVVEEEAGLPVILSALPEEIAGACWTGDCGQVVLHVNGRHFAQRRRFTLAHELGHVWCGHDGSVGVDKVETLSDMSVDPLEVEANSFAADLLVPKAALEHLAVEEPSLEEVVHIAAAYGVSAIVVVIRARQCRRVSEQRYAKLKQEIDEGVHLRLADYLGLPGFADRLGRAEPPYLSPALRGSLLDRLARGEVSVDAAADVAGCDPALLEEALDLL